MDWHDVLFYLGDFRISGGVDDMSEYIERDAFIADKKWLYCTDCEKRKGKKHGKMVTLYEIGEAPCKSCGIHDMLEEVEMYPAADVRPVVRGKWIDAVQSCHDSPHVKCSMCGEYYWRYFNKFNFCPNCGAVMGGNNGELE